MSAESLQPLLDTLRAIHTADMEAREKRHREEMAAQKKAQAEALEAQRLAHAEQLGALMAYLPKRGESAASIPSFASFDPSSELWKDYVARFETFVGANSIPESKYAQVFLTNQSPTIYKLLDTLAGQQTPPIRVNDLSMTQIQGFMEEQFDPKQFVVQERYKFWSLTKRQPGESPNDLAARLRQAAATCDFPSVKDWLDDSLRTAFVCKIDNEAVVKACFQRKPDDLTFAKAVALANEIEGADRAAKITTYGSGEGATPVFKVNPARKKGEKPPALKAKFCMRCGKTNHTSMECRFSKAQCHYCHKTGHLASVCLKKKKDKKEEVKVITSERPVQRINSVPGNHPARLTLEVNRKSFIFEVDSGARDNFCSTKTWTKLGKPPLQTAPTRYITATGSSVPVLGTFRAKVSRDNLTKVIAFNVSSLQHLDIIGRTAICDLEINILSLLKGTSSTAVNVIEKNDQPEGELREACRKLCKEFPDLFKKELGCLKDFELEVAFKPDATPIFHKPRTVPYALLEDLNAAYEAGIRKGVWVPTSFNDYGTPVVPIRKTPPPRQKAKLRVCGDYSVTVNPQLETHRHPIPRPEDLMHKLGGGCGFTKIDLADAYNQVRLAPESQKRLALSTHRGILLQTRLPFGITSAPGYFQSIMDKITSDLQGVAVYMDDLLVSGANARQHLQNLRALLQRLQNKGLRCNLAKCVFAQSSVEYLGHTLSHNGVSKGKKVDAVICMPPPSDVSTLRSFLGSVQFYGKFIPNLATLAEPLNRLLRKQTPWVWNEQEQEAFQALKEELGKDPVLAHFDPALQVGIACDASNVGIGVVLFHRYPDGRERPISNVSKTLTPTQRRYSQIHKEALAVIFGLKKFHQFLYGRKFILVTDHKPLLSLFNPSSGTPAMAANRLARWALMLSQYDYSIEYRKSTDHGNADALSRLPAGEDPLFDQEEEEEKSMVLSINMVNQQLDPKCDPLKPGVLARESSKDQVISAVIRYVREGWPHTINSEEVVHYKRLADSLWIERGCLLLGARIVIPSRLRSQVVQLIHLGHFGVQRMKQLARSVVYWPRINEDIERLCRTCTSCAEHQNKPAKPVNHPWMLPEKPWSRLHLDHAVQFMGRNWLVLVDPFSKYPCIHPTSSIGTQATIDLLEEDFAHFGYPHAIVTDNAPSFTSREFKSWCQARGITHLTGAPYHPATNGTAERMVQSFKKSVKKSSLPPKRALQEFLMQYRRTPLAFGLSPSELLNGRQIRTKIDALWPEPAHRAQGKQATEAAKSQRERTSHPVQAYKVGTPCYARYFGPRHNKQPRWIPAVVTKVYGTRSVNVRVVPHGPTWRRHIEQLRPRRDPGELPPTCEEPAMEDADPEESPPTCQEPEVEDANPGKPSPTRQEPEAPGHEAPNKGHEWRNPRMPSDGHYGMGNPRRSERIRQRTTGRK